MEKSMISLLKRLKGGKYRLREFKSLLEVNLRIAKDFASLLTKINAAKISKDLIEIKEDARAKLAIYLISKNLDSSKIIREIDWKDFELMVVNILKEYEYKVYHSVRIRKPRAEIDVLAVKNRCALAFDCKQWKIRDVSGSSAIEIVKKQINRVKALVNSNLPKRYQFKKVVPVILALYAPKPELLNGIPIVPFANLKGFLLELDGYTDRLKWFEVK